MVGVVWMARDAARGVGYHGVIRRVADRLGCGVESVRGWVGRADIDDGYPAGVSATGVQRI
jgi:hypothetical protein